MKLYKNGRQLMFLGQLVGGDESHLEVVTNLQGFKDIIDACPKAYNGNSELAGLFRRGIVDAVLEGRTVGALAIKLDRRSQLMRDVVEGSGLCFSYQRRPKWIEQKDMAVMDRLWLAFDLARAWVGSYSTLETNMVPSGVRFYLDDTMSADAEIIHTKIETKLTLISFSGRVVIRWHEWGVNIDGDQSLLTPYLLRLPSFQLKMIDIGMSVR